MKQISSIDILFLTKELQNLVNQRIETFYFENMTFYIRVYIRGQGHKYLTIKMGKYIYLGENKEDSSHPNNFVQFLRKYLKPSFIRSIEQIGTERILKIQIEKKTGEDETKENGIIISKYNLYIELFGNGNIILTNESGEIMNSLTKKKYKDRTVMNKEQYKLPPQSPLNIIEIDKKILKQEIETTDLNLVKFIAIKFGLGGKFAEYICQKLEIDKNEDPRKVNQTKLIKQLDNLKNLEVEPYTNKEHSDFYPINFNIEGQEKCESFNETLKNYFQQFKEEADPKEKEFNKHLKKLQNRLKKQQQTLDRNHKKYEEQNLIGTKIFENYTTVDELLTSINKSAKEKGWDHVKETIKNNPELKKLVNKLNYKKDEIILNLE